MNYVIPTSQSDAHRRRVAEAVEQANRTGDVVLTLNHDEADDLHRAAKLGAEQLGLLQPGFVAVLEVLDEAVKAAEAADRARHEKHWQFMSRAAEVLREDLDLSISAIDCARLLGLLQGLSSTMPDEYGIGRVVGRLAEISFEDVADLGEDHVKYKATAEKLFVIYRETE